MQVDKITLNCELGLGFNGRVEIFSYTAVCTSIFHCNTGDLETATPHHFHTTVTRNRMKQTCEKEQKLDLIKNSVSLTLLR